MNFKDKASFAYFFKISQFAKRTLSKIRGMIQGERPI